MDVNLQVATPEQPQAPGVSRRPSSEVPPAVRWSSTATSQLSDRDVVEDNLAHAGDTDGHILRATVVRQMRVMEERQEVTKEDFLEYVGEERHRQHTCLCAPILLAYFVVFAACIMAHENLKDVAQMERMIVSTLTGARFEGYKYKGKLIMRHKTMEDLDTPSDIWNFLEEGLLERFIHTLGSGQGGGDLNRATRMSRLLGGVQVQQQRRKGVECSQAYPTLGPIAKGTLRNPLLEGVLCYPWDVHTRDCMVRATNATEGLCPDPVRKRQPIARRLSGRQLFGKEHTQKVRASPFPEGMYSVTLHQHEGLAAAKAKVRHLRSINWIDEGTSWFGIKMLLINPEIAVYSHIVINVFLSASGEVLPFLTITSFPAEPYLNRAMLAADVIFGLLWLELLGSCVVGLFYAAAMRRLKAYFKRLWTWVSWASMFGGLASIIYWFVFLNRLGVVKDICMDVARTQPARQDGWQFREESQRVRYLDSAALLHSEADAMAGFLRGYRIFICWYTLLLILRFLEVFEAQPRLAIVTRTFVNSFSDIAHFLVVLTAAFLSFAVAGMMLFGHRIVEFSTLHVAIHQCFMIMLGTFEYRLLADEHNLTAGLWFFAYSCCVSIILLNMALAIIIDVYTEVCADAGDSDTIYQQIVKLVKRFQKRSWTSLRTLEEVVEDFEGDIVSLETLAQLFPKMPSEQAEELMEVVEDLSEAKENKGLSISDATSFAARMHSDVRIIARHLEMMTAVAAEERRALSDVLKSLHLDEERGVGLPEEHDHKLHVMEKRILGMEEQLREALKGAVTGFREARHTITLIEGLSGGDQDLVAI